MIVSVIVILRGHLNHIHFYKGWAGESLSDRNPTWPLEQEMFLNEGYVNCLSDRNPTWPLEPFLLPSSLPVKSLSDRNPTWPLELLREWL